MPQDDEVLKDEKSCSAEQKSPSIIDRSRWFNTPTPIRRLFKKFPLCTYPANALPQRAPADRRHHNLYIFTTGEEARLGLPSFNPSCLKWQAYLKFTGIEFSTISSNNHASPSGSLPFLIPSSSNAHTIDGGLAIPSAKLQRWAQSIVLSRSQQHVSSGPSSKHNSEHTSNAQGKTAATTTIPCEELPDMRYEAYMTLIDTKIRNAWLYTLYLHPSNFAFVATPLYIHPASTSPLVRLSLSHTLRAAARAELIKQSPVIDVDSLYRGCERAFAALSELLGDESYFFKADCPGLFDASVFAYTNVLLQEGLKWQDRRMEKGLRERGNLVRHRKRILEGFF